MGEVVRDLLKHFARKRSVLVFKGSVPLKKQHLEDVYRRSLVGDIAYALEIEIQRSVCGDTATDGMLECFCELRECYALYPNDHDAHPMLMHILRDYTMQKGAYPYENAFNKVIASCHDNRILSGVWDCKQKIWLSFAHNTSEGMRVFQKWCRDDEGAKMLPVLHKTMIAYGVEKTAQHFAREFVNQYLPVSKAQIERNTELTLERVRKRSEAALLEHRCEKAGRLRLVKN